MTQIEAARETAEATPVVPVDEDLARAAALRGRRPKRGPGPEGRRPFWMLIPGGVLMVLLIIVPFVIAIWISLVDLDQYSLRRWTEASFIGIANYVEAVMHSPMLRSIGTSVSFAVIVSLFSLPIGVAAALATQNAFRGRALVRSLFLIPYVLPAFVVGTIWRTILRPGGVFDSTLQSAGIDGGLWLNGPQSYVSLVVVHIWVTWPFFYLLVLAGLQSIDAEVHEASALDGAGWWRKLRSVIFPYLKGSIALAFLMSFIHTMNSFTIPFVLFGVPVPQDVAVLPVLTYVTSFQSLRFGLSAAIAVSSLIVIAIPLLAYLRALKLDTGEDSKR